MVIGLVAQLIVLPIVGWATPILNVVAMALGFAIATLTRLGEKRVTAITVEVGI
ncbi:MAG: hypothetical protein V7L21_30410 [Nostoc sp.]|uniref:hypothetical protein n=1 Tax=Nostoc sp. TaxID=1180 RepID=UPI002FFADD00